MPIPTVVAVVRFTNAHGPSPQQTASKLSANFFCRLFKHYFSLFSQYIYIKLIEIKDMEK